MQKLYLNSIKQQIQLTNNPMYDVMLNPYKKAETISTNDLRNTDDWEPGFYIEN